jgi:hypothetical protein
MDVAQRLYAAKHDMEQARDELRELKLRVFYNKPPTFIDSLSKVDTLAATTASDQGWQRACDREEKSIRQKRLDSMVRLITDAEVKFYARRTKFNTERKTMYDNHRNLEPNKGMSTTLHDLIERRMQIITDQVEDKNDYRTEFYFRHSYDDDDENATTAAHARVTGFTSSTIVGVNRHPLNSQQMQLLNRGPSYVSPCQMYSSIGNDKDDDDVLKKQYAPLKRQLVRLFAKWQVNLARTMEIEKKINEHFQEHFALAIPSTLVERAIGEQQLIRSIRCSLKKHQLVLRRTADQMATFYLGDAFVFDEQADLYLTKTDAYKRLLNLSDDDGQQQQQCWSEQVNEMISSMNSALDVLKRRNVLPVDVIQKLMTNDASKVQLPQLYFLPDVVDRERYSLTTHIVSQRSATSKIAKYVQRLLRPLVDKVLSATTFRDEADFMYKLHYYVYTQNRLTSTTLFCAIRISNFYTVASSHESMISTIGYFLQDNLATNKLEHVSIITIQNLVQLFLYNNIFHYNGNIYAIVRGGPNTMALSRTLSNIFLFEWQKHIVRELKPSNELFGR